MTDRKDANGGMSRGDDSDITKVVDFVRGEYEKLEQATGGADKQSHTTVPEKKKAQVSESPPQIEKVEVELHKTDKKIIDLPLHSATLTFILKNVNISIANAIRRVLVDELPSPRLNIKPGTFYSTDPFMTEHFVRDRLSQIPLLRVLNPDVQKMKFKVRAANPRSDNLLVLSSDIVPIHGKLSSPIMNPTFELAELLEKSELKMDEIFIEYGIGRTHSTCSAACNGSIQNPDLEMFSAKDINSKDGKASYSSGYKKSSLLANSREHKVFVTFPAMNEKSCDTHAKELLREAWQVIIGYNSRVRKEPRNFTTQQDGFNCTKIISPGMTDTISHIVTTYFYERNLNIEYVGSKCIPHDANIEITILHKFAEDEVNKKLDQTFDQIDSILESLKGQV